MDKMKWVELMLAFLLWLMQQLSEQKGGQGSKSPKDWLKDRISGDFSFRVGPFRISYERG